MKCPQTILEVCKRRHWQCDGSQATLILPGGRKQTLLFEEFIFEGNEMLRIFTRVGPVDKLTDVQLNAVLGINFSLAHGALAVYGNDLVMTDTFLVQESDQDQIAFAMQFLAETGDRYEKQIYATDEH